MDADRNAEVAAHLDVPAVNVPGWDLEPPWLHHPELEQTGPVVREQAAVPPDFGPGWGTQAEPRPALHQLHVGPMRDVGAWSEDYMTGTHGVVGYRAVGGQAHEGYMEPWGWDPTIDRAAPELPWDAGSTVGPGGW